MVINNNKVIMMKMLTLHSIFTIIIIYLSKFTYNVENKKMWK